MIFAVGLSFNKIQREKRHETFATFYYFEYHWGSSTRPSSKSTKKKWNVKNHVRSPKNN